ncbi:MAG: formate/nitrite transporter family protein [Eubacterium sp.]|nr:formate/nitrite transporter family protein [Eubacterium sp.]
MKPSPEILSNYEQTARTKTSMPAWKLVLSGIFAGFFIALGGLGSQVASVAIGGTAGKLAGACVFPVGLFLVVTVGVELFTGNCLLPAPWLSRKTTGVKMAGILKNWLFVYIGNFIGGMLLALSVYYGHINKMFDGALGDTMMSAAASKMALDPAEAVIKAILCNILVCLAVWVAMGSTSAGGKAIACFAPVMLFVLCGFEHSVANMYFIPTGLLLGAEGDIGAFLINNLLPVTIGNIIGGSIVVGGGVWALHHPAKAD